MSFLAAIPKLAWQILGVIALAFSLFWFKGCYDERLLKNAAAKAAVDSGNVHIAVARDTLRIKDSTVIRDKIRWVDVSRGAIAAHPGDTSVSNLVQSCNQVIVSCEDARKAAQVVIDSQDVQIKRISKMKAVQLPRFSAFAEGLYDASNKEWLGRAGVDFRIIGPVSLTGVFEGAPKDSRAKAMAGLRYTFR